MSSDKVRFAIDGCGGIATAHAKAISELPEAELVAGCDIVPERARAFAEEWKCDAYEDYGAMLARDDVQVVNVCTPSGLHAEQGAAAAEAGKHVITEKPVDVVLAKVDRLIEVAEKKGVKAACIFQHRFDRDARRLKAALDEGRFGQPLFCNASIKWYRAQSYYDSDDWRGTWKLDGGVLSNQAIHYLDQVVWLMGDVAEVTFAEIASRERAIEAETIGQATVRFKNGAWGSIQGSTLTWPGLPTRIEVCGTTGAAVLEGDKLVFYRTEGEEEPVGARHALPVLPGGASAASADPAIAALRGHDAQIADFIAALREDRDPYVTAREARRSLALLTDIYRKATGRAMLGEG